MNQEQMNIAVEMLQYKTIDPTSIISKCPASTTLLYQVCGNDPDKFDNAMRLVRLFMNEAYVAGYNNKANEVTQ